MRISLLNLRKWYWLHKWTAVIMGVVLVMWLITGITLTWEHIFPQTELVEAQLDYRTVTMSPADAGIRIKEVLDKPGQIAGMSLRQILDMAVFEVNLDDGSVILLNASTGNLVQITPDMAKEIARHAYGKQAVVSSVERINRHSVNYPYGPVPAYRVTLDDRNATQMFITVDTGSVTETDSGVRARTLLGSLHTFDALRIFTDRRRLITAVLIIASVATIIVALLGYYLALPRRWQILNKR